MKILVTGCAGFIGAACTMKLLERGDSIVGIDNLNNYYDVNLKLARLEFLKPHKNFNFYLQDLKETKPLVEIIHREKPQRILHLAAQAGVRYSIENPQVYVDANLVGFFNILEIARQYKIEHLVFASSSSVYGDNKKMPYSTDDNVDHPVSFYAATKKSNELMAHSYSHLYHIPTTGLRYFTVYGPWGRPDMAPIKFAKNIMANIPIQIYNYGKHSRDFTFIEDIVKGTLLVLDKRPENPPSSITQAPYRIYNIGFGSPVKLLDFIELLQTHLGKKAIIELLPKQVGDVDHTWADTNSLEKDFNYKPLISLNVGLESFSHWFLEYYR